MFLAAVLLVAAPVAKMVASAPIPISEKHTWARIAIPAAAPSRSIAFTLPTKLGSMRFDQSSGRVTLLHGYLHEPQQDCGLGLATVFPSTSDKATTYDIASGRILSTISERATRVGGLITQDMYPSGGGRRDSLILWDAKTGRRVWESATRESNSQKPNPYFGSIIWDTPRLRMIASQRRGVGGRYVDGVVISFAKAGTFTPSRSSVVTEAAIGFDRIVGNPESGAFAVGVANNRWTSYVTYGKDLVRTKVQGDVVYDIGSNGVLARMIAKPREYGDPDLGPLICVDPFTGKKKWSAPQRESDGQHFWLGRFALVGLSLRDGKSGKVVGKIPAGRSVLAVRGRTAWILRGAKPPVLEVWEVVP